MSTKIWRPYTQEQTAAPALKIERAEGSYLYSESGQKIFDGISSWWVITHGHCRPEIAEAIARQSKKVDQVLFANFTHEPAEELAELLVERMPSSLQKVFFSDNGSTAVEVALKMALQACAQKGQEQKTKFLAFSEAYHGDTAGAMSASGQGIYSKPYRKMTFDVIRAAQPKNSKASVQEFITDFKIQIEKHHHELAAVIVEPLIQGAAGMIVWPEESVRQIVKIAREHDILVIFDEVMTGFGRTGHLFAMNRLKVTPDLICLSKGITGGVLPLGVTLATTEIFECFLSQEKAKMLFHGHSFTGNAISCAAAVANLKIFKSEKVLARLSEIEVLQSREASQAAQKLPVRDVRVCGTVAALELDIEDASYTSQFSQIVTERALKEGLFIRPLGNVLYLLPPYSATDADLREAWATLVRAAQL